LEGLSKHVDEVAANCKKIEGSIKAVEGLGAKVEDMAKKAEKHADQVRLDEWAEPSLYAPPTLSTTFHTHTVHLMLTNACPPTHPLSQFKQLEASSKVAGEAIEVAKRAEQSLKKLESAGLVADEALTLAKKGEQHGKVLEARLQEMDEVRLES
jgi:hypothetical protein